MNDKRIYLSPPHMSGREIKLVKEVFKSNWIAPVGPDITAFEKEVCQYTGANSAVALTSGTAALHLALILSGVGEGDEVLCSSFTFAGSAFPIVYQNATPVFIDCDKKSWNMDPILLEEAIQDRIKSGKKPKACIIVHLYGNSADLDPIIEICNRYDIALIEDAAESLGTKYKDKFSGTMAPLGVYSFNGNKIITSSGGGMLVGYNNETIEKARHLSTQARDDYPYYHHTNVGYNYRMSNVVAAIGRGQLSVIEEKVEKKRSNYNRYRDIFRDIGGIDLMPQNDYERANCWLTCITVNYEICGFTNNDLIATFEENNIESRHLWKPMHRQPIFKDKPFYVTGISDGLFENGLCLPSGTDLQEDDFDRISKCILSVINR